MAKNSTYILLDLLFVAVTATCAIVAYGQHKFLSYAFVTLMLVLIVARSFESYWRWDMKLKMKVVLYDAIALTKADDFSVLPKILNLCSSTFLSAEDYKVGMEVLETSIKNNPEKAMAAFSQSLDEYYGVSDESN